MASNIELLRIVEQLTAIQAEFKKWQIPNTAIITKEEFKIEGPDFLKTPDETILEEVIQENTAPLTNELFEGIEYPDDMMTSNAKIQHLIRVLKRRRNSNQQRLSYYYYMGKELQYMAETDYQEIRRKQAWSKRQAWDYKKTAQRVFQFYRVIGLNYIEVAKTTTPRILGRFSTVEFQDLIQKVQPQLCFDEDNTTVLSLGTEAWDLEPVTMDDLFELN